MDKGLYSRLRTQLFGISQLRHFRGIASGRFAATFSDDKKGQRTGYATKYSENTIMWCHWFGTTVLLRPELRFEHAWDRKAYDDGRRQSQITVASDLIFHF